MSTDPVRRTLNQGRRRGYLEPEHSEWAVYHSSEPFVPDMQPGQGGHWSEDDYRIYRATLASAVKHGLPRLAQGGGSAPSVSRGSGGGWTTYVPQPQNDARFQWCPNCHQSVIDIERRYEGPWLISVCRFCHWQRTNRRRWAQERLRVLEKRPGDEIPRWRDIAVNPQWDDYADVNRKRHLRLRTQRIVDRGEDFNFEPRTLGKAYRSTMEGQLALEYGYIGKNGKPGPQVKKRRLEEIALCQELLACVVCQKQNKLDGLWICERCKTAWIDAGEPYGDAYGTFAIKQRWSRIVPIYRMPRDLDFYQSAIRVKAEKALEPFDQAADSYPWRTRLILFHYYTNPLEDHMAGTIEVVRGPAESVAAYMKAREPMDGQWIYQQPLPEGFQVSEEMGEVLSLARKREQRRRQTS